MSREQALPSEIPIQSYWSPPQLRQSGLGVASFALALLAGAATLALLILEIVMETRTPGGGMQEDTIGLVITLAVLVAIVGLALGSAGVVQRDRRKVFAVLGLILNGAAVLTVAAVIVIGVIFA